MQPIRLIATDYDNTLVGRDNSMIMMDQFRHQLEHLRTTIGTKWAIVTGRDYKSITSVVKQFARRGLKPDYLILSEGYIFKRTKLGYCPNLKWNWSIWKQYRMLDKKLKAILPDWQKQIASKWPEARNRSKGSTSLWFTFENEEQCIEVENFLKERVKFIPELIIFKHTREIYLGVTFCAKGYALAELAHTLEIPLSQTFAIGDGPNDISMLNGTSAGMIACVNNAKEEVKATVEKAGGFIATQNSLLGVIESLKFYINLESSTCSNSSC